MSSPPDPDGLSPEERRIAARIRDLPEIEPAPGYVERAVERARREGLFERTRPPRAGRISDG
jgi:hypothetical protein